MKKIRIGMVGVNNFGRYRRERLRETGLFNMIACYDFDTGALAAAAAEEQCIAAESFDALLANAEIEAIVVSTGANSHADYCIRAANAGKHFFVEKPLCCNREELDALLAAGERAGVVMGMGHDAHDGPIDQCLQDYLESGKLGTISAIEMTTCHGGGWCESSWRFDPAKNPGGMLFQCGVHDIAWLEATFGPVAEVAAMMNYDINPNTRTADVSNALLRMASGLLVTLHAYHVTAYHHYKFIYGTEGNLYCYAFPLEVFYQARSHDGKPEEKVSIDVDSLYPKGTAGMTNLLTWANAIRGDGAPSPSIYDGAGTVNVVFAATESATTGQFVRVPSCRKVAK